MKLLVSVAALLLSATAFATHPAPEPTPPAEQPINVDAQADARAAAIAQLQAQLEQLQGQQQTAEASANNAGNDQKVSVSSVYKQVRQTASAHADAGNATIRCGKDRRAGIQLPGIGFSVGGTVEAIDCDALLQADVELAQGNIEVSRRLRCTTKVYRRAYPNLDECVAMLNTQTVVKETVSREYVDHAIRKALTVTK